MTAAQGRRRVLGTSTPAVEEARLPLLPDPADLVGRASSSPDLPVADLVGWATDHAFKDDEPVSADLARELLGTALGLKAGRLKALGESEVRGALGRLRGLVRQIERLGAEAAEDDLTGALRRGAGLQALAREIARFRRFGGKGVAVIFIDVDGLKSLNDTEGHAAGDALLSNVVAAIRERVRAYDLVIRWGGDEFVCVLPDATGEEAERTVADIERQVRLRTRGRSVSTGLAGLEVTDTAGTLVDRADAALYARREVTRSRA
ncbi:MAG: GGDEF domain-containing protein [Candidatus Dormibacteria bacterium]|jgi:diguanylate cyclase (GGDEF)-like protein